MINKFTIRKKNRKNQVFFLLPKLSENILFEFAAVCILLISCSQVYAQVSVTGRVTSSRFPVKEALVTFVDNADTLRKYSALTDATGNYTISSITSVEAGKNIQPEKFGLEQNYPNPFAVSTVIPYEVNEPVTVNVTIYDILGRVVRTFNAGQQSAGAYNVLWDGRNSIGQTVANGIYFYRLEADGQSLVKKMIYNQGSKGVVSLPGSFSPRQSLSKSNSVQNNQGTTFTIRVENTGTTAPYVVTKEIPGVVIERDTTININVDYLPVAAINLDSLRQYIRGFGAANIIAWRPDLTDSEIETAFGTGDGQLGFSILRIMLEPDSSRWNLYVHSAKKAYDMGAIVFASPWNAPPSVLETVDGNDRVRHDKYAEYAAHLDGFNTFMTNHGVPLYAVSVQNEPDFANDWTGWTPDEMLTFMRDYAGTIGTRVMAPESFQFRHNITDPLLNDSAACANLDIVGGHIYGAGLAAYPLALQKGKELWMTEHLTGENNSIEWSWALPVGKEINDIMKADMSAYIWWYMVRYYGPISDGTNNSGRKGEVTKKGYVMSQFARFIRPGFYRVESSVIPSSSKVEITAYKDPLTSKTVIVAVNTGAAAETVFRMQEGSFSFTPYTTSETKNCEKGSMFNVTGGNFHYTLEASSITTFVSE